jgi:beta-N-acetylhexosaminidase
MAGVSGRRVDEFPGRTEPPRTVPAWALSVVLTLALTLSGACGQGALRTDEPRSAGDGTGSDSTSTPASPDPTPLAGRQPRPSSRDSAARPPRTPSALSWGPTRAEWREAERIVAGMSAAEKAGQVIVAGFGGTRAPVSLVRDLHVGGVILMGHNIASASQVRALNLELAAAARQEGRTWPLVTSVDQEGGRVARLQSPLTEFPTYMTFGAAQDPSIARSVARASGRELRALGFSMVFAPDADVTTGPSDPTIGSRSAGSDPDLVAEVVEGSLRGYSEAGIVAVPKHFPGHGSVPADSHVSLPVQEDSVRTLAGRDLVPFRAAVAARAGAVMVAHIDVRSVDPGRPSSVSPDVIEGLLRERVGFDGAVVTDALGMAGVAEKYGSADAGVRALIAGADILLLPDDAAALHGAILRALDSGRLRASRLDEAAARSVALMLHQKATSGPRPSVGVVGDASRTSYAATLSGMTVVSGRCSGRLVGDRVEVVGADERDRDRFGDAARAAGLEIGGGGSLVRLLSQGSSGGPGDVVVALDTPYSLADSQAETARIALYGRTRDAYRALVDVLTGEARSGGRLPVDVDGIRPGAGCG